MVCKNLLLMPKENEARHKVSFDDTLTKIFYLKDVILQAWISSYSFCLENKMHDVRIIPPTAVPTVVLPLKKV